MTIVNELNKLAEKITGTNPKATTDKKVLDYIADYYAQDNLKPTTNAQAVKNITDNFSEGETPTGTISITENGTYDVTDKASAEVNVSGPELYVKSGDTYYKRNGAYYLAQNIDKAKVDDTTMDYVFYNCSGISSIPKLYSTKQITSAVYAFGNCEEALKIDLSEITWASSNININSMFYGCNELDVLDISSLDFRNVTTSNAETFECGSFAEVSKGGYAEGIPYVYVKDAYAQDKVIQIASQKQYGGTWTTDNVVIKS